jgi:hypothetical protein
MGNTFSMGIINTLNTTAVANRQKHTYKIKSTNIYTNVNKHDPLEHAKVHTPLEHSKVHTLIENDPLEHANVHTLIENDPLEHTAIEPDTH